MQDVLRAAFTWRKVDREIADLAWLHQRHIARGVIQGIRCRAVLGMT